MKRPLVGMAAALVLGEVIAKAENSISVVVWIVVSVCCVIFCMIDKQKYKMFLVMPACMGVGILLASQASKIPALDSYFKQETLNCQVTGTVYWKEWTGKKWKIYIEESEIQISLEFPYENQELEDSDNQSNSVDIRRYNPIFTCKKVLLYVETSKVISIGSVIQAQGTVAQFATATNEGQFDARQYYRAKNIAYPVYVSGNVTIVKMPKNDIRETLMTMRLSLLESLEQICLEDEFGIFQAVFLGEKTSIDTEIQSLYQANGISHILAISGLHISFIGNLLYKLLKRITGSYSVSMIGGVCLLVAYGWMTGFAVSALRAVIMFVCMMGAQTIGRTYDMLSSAGLSAILVLLEYPLQLYEAGFLLTYGAIIGIAGVMPCLEELLQPKKNIVKSFLCSFSVQVTTLPIMLWFFYTYPIYSIVLNLFVIPFAGYLLFSAMAGSVVGMWWQMCGQFFIGSGHFVLQYYNMLCHFVEKIPFATDIVGKPALWQIYVYYVVVIGGLYGGRWYRNHLLLRQQTENEEEEPLERNLQIRIVFVTTTLFVALYQFLHPIPDSYLHITMLDVDQGDCIYVHMPEGQDILIDGGSTGVQNVGTYRIIPYLLAQGVDVLEKVVVTHPDEDHVNGIYELLKDGRIKIEQLCIPNMEENEDGFAELLKLVKEQGIQVSYIKANDKWDTYWTCLHPWDGFVGSDTNSYSVILRLEYGSFSALFTGDAGIKQEQLLTLEPVTLLKVGHHGSKYSSGAEFLSQIVPWISIISCGQDNFYGHPHEETMKRLEEIGSRIITTPEVGAIQIKTDGIRYWVETFLERDYE